MINHVKLTALPMKIAFVLLYGKHPWMERIGDRILVTSPADLWRTCGVRKDRFGEGIRTLQSWGVLGTVVEPQKGALSLQLIPPAGWVACTPAPTIDSGAPNRDADALSTTAHGVTHPDSVGRYSNSEFPKGDDTTKGGVR